MTTRIVQLISRYIAMGLTAAAGWLGAQEYVDRIGDLSQSLAAAVVAVMLFIVDLLIHKWGTGGVLAPPGTPGEAKTQASNGTGRSMYSMLLLSMLLLPMLASGGGCSATPARQTLIARETYISTLNSIATLRQGGFIDDVTTLQIESIRKVAARALDDMDAAAQAGDQLGFGQAAGIFNAALDRLIELQSQVQLKGTNHDGTGDPDAGPRVRRGSVVLDPTGRTTATRGARPDARRDRGSEGTSGRRRTELAGSLAGVTDKPGDARGLWRERLRRHRLCANAERSGDARFRGAARIRLTSGGASGGRLITDALSGCRADVPPAVQVSTHRVACTAFDHTRDAVALMFAPAAAPGGDGRGTFALSSPR